MPLHVPVSQGTVPEIADGTYPIHVVKVGEKTLENDQFGNNHKALLTCQFEVVDEETGQFLELDAMCNFVISEKSKLTEWLTALGVNVDLSAKSVDIEQAVNKAGLATVIHKDGKGWPRIDNILPPLAGGKKAKPATVVLPDGSADLNVFWTQINAAGLNRKHVIDALGDIEELVEMDGPDVQKLLDELKAKADA